MLFKLYLVSVVISIVISLSLLFTAYFKSKQIGYSSSELIKKHLKKSYIIYNIGFVFYLFIIVVLVNLIPILNLSNLVSLFTWNKSVSHKITRLEKEGFITYTGKVDTAIK